MKKLHSSVGYGALIAIFLGLVIVNNVLFDKARLDLTENNIYSISDGSKRIVEKLDEPINLYFFFSEKNSEGITHIRNYASRVKSLLEEYSLHSGGMINLHIIDPEPFSEAEDRAANFGLTAASIGNAGDTLYFGLGATNSTDSKLSLPFFDPAKEEFLEYDLSQLIYKLSDPAKVKLAIMGDLPYQGTPSPNPMMPNQGQPAWVFYDQLQQLYDVVDIEATASEIPDDVKVLMLVHPKNISEDMQKAIDQFVLKGGSLFAFIDPHAEIAAAYTAQPGMPPMQNASDIDTLLKGWGIEFDSSKVVLDAASALEIGTQQGGSTKHFAYLGLSSKNLDLDDVVVSSLNLLNGASFGALSSAEDAEFAFTPLLTSSEHSSTYSTMAYSSARDPREFQRGFAASGESYTLAARISGKLKSAFENEVGSEQLSETEQANIIIVADSDMLADNFWVQKSNFFGQTILNPFASNGDFLANAVENLGGSSDLIGIRARGKFTRPFDVVNELTVAAEARFREKEQQLQKRLEETETKLAELNGQQTDGTALILSQEQSDALASFQKEKSNIRKGLREVRHQLDKDIDALGSFLKFINIALMPLLLTLILALISRRFRKSKLLNA